MQQIYNPYLPTFEYVPDGEPHVFGDRVYVYGSHDRFDGAYFCLNDYVAWSAPVTDLTDWRYEGVILRKDQDPRNQAAPGTYPMPEVWPGIPIRREHSLNPEGMHAQFAPDVVRGADGRYYLFYCLDCLPQVAVAVCDEPAGAYEFHGFVRHADGQLLGEKEGDLFQFDPGVFLDDDGTVYLYSGNAPMTKENIPYFTKTGSQVMTLESDMLTLSTEPRKLMPDLRDSEGSGYEGHEFFEASSIRKIRGKYYFVYSSVRSHELCYAVSDRPDAGYEYGGTIVDIGDVFLDGREEQDALMPLGNTHGGIELINGQWYVFYHRQTNRTNFSRQACAEKIAFDEDGRIAQVEVTSCGLNGGALRAEGMYPAAVCCRLTRGGHNVQSHPKCVKMDYPFLTQDADDTEPTAEAIAADRAMPLQYLCNLKDGACAGYKYFDMKDGGNRKLRLLIRTSTYDPELSYPEGRPAGAGEADAAERDAASALLAGAFLVSVVPDPEEDEILGVIRTDAVCGGSAGSSDSVAKAQELRVPGWGLLAGDVVLPGGIHPLYLTYRGDGALDLRCFVLA